MPSGGACLGVAFYLTCMPLSSAVRPRTGRWDQSHAGNESSREYLSIRDEDKDGGEDSVAIGKTGHFVNLSTGSSRRTSGAPAHKGNARSGRFHRE